MKHLPILISITIITLLTNACKYKCPGFDKSLLSWIPKNEGDTLNYTNVNTDTLSFVVEKKNYSKAIGANNYGLIKFYEKSGVEWSLLVD